MIGELDGAKFQTVRGVSIHVTASVVAENLLSSFS